MNQLFRENLALIFTTPLVYFIRIEIFVPIHRTTESVSKLPALYEFMPTKLKWKYFSFYTCIRANTRSDRAACNLGLKLIVTNTNANDPIRKKRQTGIYFINSEVVLWFVSV